MLDDNRLDSVDRWVKLVSTYHLFDGEGADVPNPDGHVEHLPRDEVSLTSALEPGHLNQHCDVPGERGRGGEGEGEGEGGRGRGREGEGRGREWEGEGERGGGRGEERERESEKRRRRKKGERGI